MTITFPRVEAYLWSDGVSPPTFPSCQRFEADKGGFNSDRVLSAPAPFSDALNSFVAGMTIDLPGTFDWTMTQAGVLSLVGTGAWDVTWHGAAQRAFGFEGSQTGTSGSPSGYSSTLPLLLCVPVYPADVQPADDGSVVDLVPVENGRDFGLHFATHERWRLQLVTTDALADAFRVGYCGRGRVRFYQGADASFAAVDNLDGFIDGWVYGCSVSAPNEIDGLVDVELLLARVPA